MTKLSDRVANTNQINLNELSSSPSNPSTGQKKLYAKDDGKIYTLDSSGNEEEVISGSSANMLFDVINPKDANGISVKNAAGDTTNVFVADNGKVEIGESIPHGTTGSTVKHTVFGSQVISNHSTDASINNKPYITLSNRGPNIGYTASHPIGGILADCFRDISDPGYIAGITFHRDSAVGGLSSTGSMIFRTTGTALPNTLPPEQMRITSGGYVGIGASNPKGKLDVSGNSEDLIVLSGSDPGAVPAFRLINLDTNASGSIDGWKINYRPSYTTGSGAGPDKPAIELINTYSRNNADLALLPSGGNVGIGTSSPVSNLEVKNSGTPGTKRTVATFSTAESTDGTEIDLDFAQAGTVVGKITSVYQGPAQLGMAFSTYNAGLQSEVVTISANGDVGVGTTSPRSGYKFHIQENTGNGLNIQAGDESTDVIASFGSAGTPDKVIIEANGRLLASGNITVRGETDSAGGIVFFNLASASTAFQITTNTSDFYITDSDFSNFALLAGQSFAGWTFGSDRRIKENIQDCRYGLESVLKIQPRQYNLIASGEESIGFVAQELRNVIPEAVTGQEVEYDENDTPEERAKKTLGVCKETLIPVLVKAIQEQQAQIAALEARLATLESK
jgi:hypothetical protein